MIPLKKINKIYKYLDISTKSKRKNTQIIKVSKKKLDKPQRLKKSIRGYYKQLYAKKIRQLILNEDIPRKSQTIEMDLKRSKKFK